MVIRRTATTQPLPSDNKVSVNHKASVPHTIDDIVSEIFKHRRINKATQQQLMNALLGKAELNSQEEAQVKRVFDAVHQGRLRVVD